MGGVPVDVGVQTRQCTATMHKEALGTAGEHATGMHGSFPSPPGGRGRRGPKPARRPIGSISQSASEAWQTLAMLSYTPMERSLA